MTLKPFTRLVKLLFLLPWLISLYQQPILCLFLRWQSIFPAVRSSVLPLTLWLFHTFLYALPFCHFCSSSSTPPPHLLPPPASEVLLPIPHLVPERLHQDIPLLFTSSVSKNPRWRQGVKRWPPWQKHSFPQHSQNLEKLFSFQKHK